MHDLSGFVDAYADNRNQRLQVPCTHSEPNLWNWPADLGAPQRPVRKVRMGRMNA
jgi:hypothetical protein